MNKLISKNLPQYFILRFPNTNIITNYKEKHIIVDIFSDPKNKDILPPVLIIKKRHIVNLLIKLVKFIKSCHF